MFVACLTPQQQARVSQGRICSDKFTCCHTETEVVDQTFYLTQSKYTDTGSPSPSADPTTPDVWQGSHWSGTGMTRPEKIPPQAGFEPRIFRSRGGRLNHYTNEAVFQERSCMVNCKCCHTEAHQACYLDQSRVTDTGKASPSTDPIIPGPSRGSHDSTNFSHCSDEMSSTSQVLWAVNFCYFANLYKHQRQRVFPWCRSQKDLRLLCKFGLTYT